MLSRQSLLYKAFSMGVDFFHLVVITFVLNTLADSEYITSFAYIKFLILVPLKIVVSAGIWVSIIELISTEEVVITFKRIGINAKKYWKHYFLLSFFPLFVALTVSLGVYELKAQEIVVFLRYVNILIFFIFIKWIVSIKYLEKGSSKNIANRLKISDVLGIGVLYIIDIFLFYLPVLFNVGSFDLQNLVSLASEAVHYLQFIYLTMLVLEAYPEIPQRFQQKKEIYLISPYPYPSPKVFALITAAFQSWYPTVFFIIRAFTPKEYKVRHFIYTLWKRRYYKPNKLVAITCTTANCAAAYKIAKGFKSCGSKVVMGGPHVSFLPEEALEYCDSIIIGELESVWEQVIADYESGTLKKKYFGEFLDNFYEKVHDELMETDDWGSKFIVENVRGCKYHCDFCLVQPLNGSRLRKKPMDQVIELIRKVRHKTRKISFIDNNIYNDPNYAKELFRALIPLHMRWNAFCSVDIGSDPEALALAKKSGCNILIIGYEVFNKSEESNRGGKFKLIDKYMEYSKAIRKAGIKSDNAFIYGFDSDHFRNLFKFWNFCFAIRSGVTNISMLTPFPGTQIYTQFLKENRMKNLNWRKYDGVHLLYKLKKMNDAILSLAFPIIRNFFYYSTSKFWLRLSAGLLVLYLLFVKNRYF